MKNNDQPSNIAKLHEQYQNTPFIVTFKNPENLEILYANKMMCNYVGSSQNNNILGKTDFDFRWSNFATLYEAHELDALQGDCYVAMFPGCDVSGKESVFMCHRSPIRNDQQVILGVLTHTYILQDKKHLELSNLLDINTPSNTSKLYNIGSQKKYAGLTQRERECLFFCIRGRSNKMIALIFDLSERTVETHIDNIKMKFNSASKNEMIAKAISLGYLYDIPPTLFNKDLASTFY